MTLEKIQDSTPVHDFPAIHNGNIDSLEAEIERLNNVLSQKDRDIADLKTKFNAALNTLRAEYIAMIDELKSRIEDNQ